MGKDLESVEEPALTDFKSAFILMILGLLLALWAMVSPAPTATSLYADRGRPAQRMPTARDCIVSSALGSPAPPRAAATTTLPVAPNARPNAGPASITFEFGLSQKIETYRGLSREETQAAMQFVHDSIDAAKPLMTRTDVINYFQDEYGMSPRQSLDGIKEVRLVHFTNFLHCAELIGAEHDIIELEIWNPLAGIKSREGRQLWVDNEAVMVVHECCHRAAVLSGKHWDQLDHDKDDEATIMERRTGIFKPTFPEYRRSLEELLAEP